MEGEEVVSDRNGLKFFDIFFMDEIIGRLSLWADDLSQLPVCSQDTYTFGFTRSCYLLITIFWNAVIAKYQLLAIVHALLVFIEVKGVFRHEWFGADVRVPTGIRPIVVPH